MAFLRLLEEMSTYMHQQSCDRDPLRVNVKKFNTSVTPTTAQYEEAYGLTLKKDFFKRIEITFEGKNIIVFVSADPNKDLIIDDITATSIASLWFQKSWSTFDEYCAMIVSTRLVIVDETNRANFHGVVCLCVDFQKRHLCIDAIAVASILQKCTIPENCKVTFYFISLFTPLFVQL